MQIKTLNVSSIFKTCSIYKLSIPSVIFADANWYGSLRGGIEVGGDADATFKDGGSRWGIKGSSEISEGLSAVYRFEHKISTENAGQPGGRLAYAGLSGGFGTVSLGQVWSASFNHVGGITDGSWFYGNSETSYRVGNALSYSTTAGAISLQIDAIMDGSKDTGDAVDQLEFGMSVDLGDIGKVGLAYVDKKDQMMATSMTMYDSVSTSTSTSTTMIDGQITTTISGGVMTTIDGDVNTTVTIGNIVSMINGDIEGSITNANITGDVMASVMLTGYTDPESAYPQTPRGSCVLYVGDGDPGVPTYETQSVCEARNDADTNTVAVWALDPNLSSVDDPTKDKTIASLTPKAGTNASIVVSGVSKISDVADIKYFDDEGNELTRVVRWSHISSSPNLPTIPGNADASEHERCLARTSSSEALCSQAIVYLDADGEVYSGDRTSSGSISLDGSSLSLSDGTVRITGPDGVETTIAADQINAVSTHTLTADSDHTLTADSTHDLDADTTTTTTTTARTVEGTEIKRGSRDTHIAAQFNLGAITGYVGYSQSEENGSEMKDKTTHYGVSGGLGDTGISFHAMARSKDNADGSTASPWLVGLTKGLGGGATIMMEHGNADDGKSGKTRFGLKVDF